MNLVSHWKNTIREVYAERHTYQPLDYSASTSVFRQGVFVDELSMGRIGLIKATDLEDDERKIYDIPLAFDSTIEYEIMKAKPIREISIFGKLPRESIKTQTDAQPFDSVLDRPQGARGPFHPRRWRRIESLPGEGAHN